MAQNLLIAIDVKWRLSLTFYGSQKVGWKSWKARKWLGRPDCTFSATVFQILHCSEREEDFSAIHTGRIERPKTSHTGFSFTLYNLCESKYEEHKDEGIFLPGLGTFGFNFWSHQSIENLTHFFWKFDSRKLYCWKDSVYGKAMQVHNSFD